MARTNITLNMKSFVDMEKDLDALAVAVSRRFATYITDEMYNAAEVVLAQYYGEYKPKVYRRTGQLKSKRSHLRSYKSPHGIISYGGVMFTPDRMKDYVNTWKDPETGAEQKNVFEAEWVVDNFLSGWHGSPDNPKAVRGNFVARRALTAIRNEIVNEICHSGLGSKLYQEAKASVNLKSIT